MQWCSNTYIWYLYIRNNRSNIENSLENKMTWNGTSPVRWWPWNQSVLGMEEGWKIYLLLEKACPLVLAVNAYDLLLDGLKLAHNRASWHAGNLTWQHAPVNKLWHLNRKERGRGGGFKVVLLLCFFLLLLNKV